MSPRDIEDDNFEREFEEFAEREDMQNYENMDEDDFDCFAFANPGGNSALRAATSNNPRNLSCPTCHEPNRLTPADVALGYQCDACADAAEGCGP